ncbi:MAG: hypothetical protein CV087_08780 [Candidatus Brocadia sp. WS118]|nr:MAG: hypothetical protein CV087_08780 [Candidatus Brocadia sp. WS118]
MKKVAIVCGSPNSEFIAPFDDDSWEIWVLGNRLNRFQGKRVTKVFEIHDDLSEHGDPNNYAQWLAAQKLPLVVGEAFPIKSKDIQVFPFEEAKKLYGATYLTSSPAYMIALAILEGATHIGIYGVDLSVDDHEYFWQRPCVEAWIGFAKGMGINVIIPTVSPIGRCDYVEGLGRGGKPDFSKPPFTQKEFINMAQQHENKVNNLLAQIKELELAVQGHSGAQQVYERMAKVARAIESGQDIKTLSETALIK